MNFYYVNKFFIKKENNFQEIKSNSISLLPIKNITLQEQKIFIDLADYLLNKNFEIFDIKNNFASFLSVKFNILNNDNQLIKWYELDTYQFLKVISQQNFRISTKEENQLLEYYREQKELISIAENNIIKVEKILNEQIFKLYKLTEEDINIINIYNK
jgi:predicted ribonuclease YlaK